MKTELFEMVNANHDRKVSRAKQHKSQNMTLTDVVFLLVVPISCALMALAENLL